ncbi:MAG: CDP-alcohol phosphatidyltransferase family protein [Nitrospinota bacterium]
MLSAAFGGKLDAALDWALKRIRSGGVNPCLLTSLGLLVHLVAGGALAWGAFVWGGVLTLAAGAFDVLDGAMARASGRNTPFGGFYDSVVDRYSDGTLLLGLLGFYLWEGSRGMVLLTAVVLLGALVTPYTRARAECFIPSCAVGVLERADRHVVLALGALTGWMAPALWVMAVLSHLTVGQRVLYTWRELERGPASGEGRQVVKLRRFYRIRGGGAAP